MNKCDFCNSTFIKKSNLDYHLKTNKKCNIIRGIVLEVFKCDICSKELSTKYNLEKHIKTCKERKEELYQEKITELEKLINKKNKIIKKLEIAINIKIEQIKDNDTQLRDKDEQLKYKDEQIKYKDQQLKDKDEELKEKNKTITEYLNKLNSMAEKRPIINNTINNITNYLNKVGDINLEDFQSNRIKYESYKNPKDFYKILGTYLALNTSLKNKVICSDISRNITYYMKDGVITKDQGGISLLEYVLRYKTEEIKTQINEVLNITKEIKDIDYKYDLQELLKYVIEYEEQPSIDSSFIRNVSSEFIKKIPNKTNIPSILKNINEDGTFFKKLDIDDITKTDEMLELLNFLKNEVKMKKKYENEIFVQKANEKVLDGYARVGIDTSSWNNL
jgi:hypothetical protein